MEKIVIFGTGSGAEKVLKHIDFSIYKLIVFVDNNENRQGHIFYRKEVIGPKDLDKVEFDKIVICSIAYKEIYKQLVDLYKIEPQKIVKNTYFIKQKLIKKYENVEDKEVHQIMTYLSNNDLKIFNYDFSSRYENKIIDAKYDSDVNMFYVLHKGKRMYFNEDFKEINEVIDYYKFLCQEQDIDSPHRYLIDSMKVESGDVVVDAGVAEGNFAIEVIDNVSKIYLIEENSKWIKALKETFKDYKDKVIFVNKYLTDNNSDNSITLDELLGDENVNFIKMDIEGEEVKALKGGSKVLTQSKKIKLAICAYHNNDDERDITKILESFNFMISTSKGYMFYSNYDTFNINDIRFVRGLIRGTK